MKITCKKQNLLEAVLNVQHAVSSKSCLTALEGILIKTYGDEILLCGYDLELGITTKIKAEIDKAILSRDLIRLKDDLDLSYKYEVTEPKGLNEFLLRFGFKSLIKSQGNQQKCKQKP